MEYLYYEPTKAHILILNNREIEELLGDDYHIVSKRDSLSSFDAYFSTVIKEPVYEWLLENVGPSRDMMWDIDRLYYRSPPDLPKNREEWKKNIKFVGNSPNKWLIASSFYFNNKSHKAFCFTSSDMATLFKLRWSL